MGLGPASGRSWRAALCALSPCVALTLSTGTELYAQTLTPDMLRPVRGGFLAPQDSPLRPTSERTGEGLPDSIGTGDLRQAGSDTAAPSRVGRLPTYGVPAANGASEWGYDSLNRKRKKPKYYPGQARPKPPPGPGTPATTAANPNARVRLSVPPSEFANKAPIPPAMAGTVVGQPARKRLRIDDDPFGAVGDYAGSFLLKGAVELSASYDTNPGRLAKPQGLPFYVIAPELLAVSDWERYAAVADLRGSFTGYG